MKSIALLAGLLFGTGLIVSGMSNPANILAFLDFTRSWNPTLAFVMVSAIATAAPAFAHVRRHSATWGGTPVQLPNRTLINWRLVTGAAIFGVGWGLSGLCPGPALVLAAGGSPAGLVFVASMALGIWLCRKLLTQAAITAQPKGLTSQT